MNLYNVTSHDMYLCSPKMVDKRQILSNLNKLFQHSSQSIYNNNIVYTASNALIVLQKNIQYAVIARCLVHVTCIPYDTNSHSLVIIK